MAAFLPFSQESKSPTTPARHHRTAATQLRRSGTPRRINLIKNDSNVNNIFLTSGKWSSESEVILSPLMSSRSAALLPPPPLRTVRESFPSYGSSNSKFLIRNRLKIFSVTEVIKSSAATVMGKELYNFTIFHFFGKVPFFILVNRFSTDRTHAVLFLP